MNFVDVPNGADPKRVAPRTVNISQCVTDRVSMIDKITHPKQVCGQSVVVYSMLYYGSCQKVMKIFVIFSSKVHYSHQLLLAVKYMYIAHCTVVHSCMTTSTLYTIVVFYVLRQDLMSG